MHSSSYSSGSKSKISKRTTQISEIFSQTESISQYIKSHIKDKANDVTFILLQEFFGVFHDQMRINFDLRNKLANFTHGRKNLNYDELQVTKSNVDTFMKYFNQTRQIEHQSLHDISLTLKDDVQILSELRELLNERSKTKQSIRDLKEKIEHYEQKIDVVASRQDRVSEELKEVIDKSNVHCVKLQTDIDDMRPAVEALRQRVEEKENNKKNLLETLLKRNQLVLEAKKMHEESHQKRHDTKQELRTLHGKLTAEFHNLQYQEKPLAKALEDAQSKLEEVKKQNAKQIQELNQKSEIAVHKIETIDVKLQELLLLKQKNQKEIEEAKRTIELQTCKHENALTELKLLRQQNSKLSVRLKKLTKEFGTPEDSLKTITEQKEGTAEKIRVKTKQIEDLRTENQRISSLIRVANESSDSLEEENSQMRVTVSESEIKVKTEKEQFTGEIERRNLARKTIKAFVKMRDGMRLSGLTDSYVLAQKALEFVRSTEEMSACREDDSEDEDSDDIPMRVTTKLVSENIDKLAFSISKLSEKLQ